MDKEERGLGNPALVVTAGSWMARNWKTLAILAGGGITIYATVKIVKSLASDGISNDSKLPPATINDTQARVFADRLYEAMASGGTSEDVIYEIMGKINHNDYVKISKAFGKRSYVYLTGEGAIFDWMGADLNLTEWIIEELSANELNELAGILPSVFK